MTKKKLAFDDQNTEAETLRKYIEARRMELAAVKARLSDLINRKIDMEPEDREDYRKKALEMWADTQLIEMELSVLEQRREAAQRDYFEGVLAEAQRELDRETAKYKELVDQCREAKEKLVSWYNGGLRTGLRTDEAKLNRQLELELNFKKLEVLVRDADIKLYRWQTRCKLAKSQLEEEMEEIERQKIRDE